MERISSTPRILIVRLSAHGDIIHTLPLLAALKKQYPGAVIGWLTDSSSASLLKDHPYLDALHIWPRSVRLGDFLNPLKLQKALQTLKTLLAELKAQRYEISLDAQGLLKSAIWPFMAKIPRRLGFQKTREWADVFYNERLPYRNIRSAGRSAVDQTLDLARALGCEPDEPDFGPLPITQQTRDTVEKLLMEVNPEKPLVVLAPFTRWASKHWKPEAWPVLMKCLLELDAQLAVIGAKPNAPAVDEMLSTLPSGHSVLNLAGKTDWTDLYALFERTRLMIGLDSGPLHIANAVGVPAIIGIYGPTASGRTGPVGGRHTILEAGLPCQPCYSKTCRIKSHQCMRDVTPHQVLEAAKRYLNVPREALA